MAKGQMQTNRRLGEASLALYAGKSPSWLPPVPITDLGALSINHYDEGVSVALAARLPGSIKQAERRLEWQRDNGHCQRARTSEFESDSHAPIELRAQALGYWAALRYKLDKLTALYLQWWARQIYVDGLLFVDRGPRAGSVVGLGGRYQDGWDDTRDVVFALITRRPHGKSEGYFKRAETTQDLLASLIVRDLVRQGAFDNIKLEPPVLPFEYTVEHYRNGHVCTTPNGGLQPGDPTMCWVRYSDGAIGTKGDVPDLGEKFGVVTLPIANKAGKKRRQALVLQS